MAAAGRLACVRCLPDVPADVPVDARAASHRQTRSDVRVVPVRKSGDTGLDRQGDLTLDFSLSDLERSRSTLTERRKSVRRARAMKLGRTSLRGLYSVHQKFGGAGSNGRRVRRGIPPTALAPRALFRHFSAHCSATESDASMPFRQKVCAGGLHAWLKFGDDRSTVARAATVRVRVEKGR